MKFRSECRMIEMEMFTCPNDELMQEVITNSKKCREISLENEKKMGSEEYFKLVHHLSELRVRRIMFLSLE